MGANAVIFETKQHFFWCGGVSDYHAMEVHIVVLQKSLAILFPHHPQVDTPHVSYRFMD